MRAELLLQPDAGVAPGCFQNYAPLFNQERLSEAVKTLHTRTHTRARARSVLPTGPGPANRLFPPFTQVSTSAPSLHAHIHGVLPNPDDDCRCRL